MLESYCIRKGMLADDEALFANSGNSARKASPKVDKHLGCGARTRAAAGVGWGFGLLCAELEVGRCTGC